MKKIAIAMLVLVAGFAFTACEDEKYPTPPTFKGFTVTPTPAHPGDTVTITAVYASKGQYVNKPRCNWSVKMDTLVNNTTTTNSYTWSKSVTNSIGDENLSIKMVLPKTTKTPQTLECKFDVAFDNIVDATNVGFTLANPTQQGYIGKFNNSTIQSILYSHSSGSVQFTVE